MLPAWPPQLAGVTSLSVERVDPSMYGSVVAGALAPMLRVLHARWSGTSANRPLPSVIVVDVAGNERLGGQIPDGWGKPGRTFIITQGESTVCT